MLWRLSQGAFGTGGGRFARFGLTPGASDLIGILRLYTGIGRFIALEVKAGKGRQSEEQMRFAALVQRFGGFAAAVWSVEDARQAIREARRP